MTQDEAYKIGLKFMHRTNPNVTEYMPARIWKRNIACSTQAMDFRSTWTYGTSGADELPMEVFARLLGVEAYIHGRAFKIYADLDAAISALGYATYAAYGGGADL